MAQFGAVLAALCERLGAEGLAAYLNEQNADGHNAVQNALCNLTHF